MGQIHVDDMTLEILYTELREIKSAGSLQKMCFAQIGLMVALEEWHVRNQDRRLSFGI